MKHKSKYVKFIDDVYFELYFHFGGSERMIEAYFEYSTKDEDVKLATIEVDGEFFANLAAKYINQKDLLDWLLVGDLKIEEVIGKCVDVVYQKMNITADKWVVYIDPVIVGAPRGEIIEYEVSFKSDKGVRFTLGDISGNEDDAEIPAHFLNHILKSVNQKDFDRACYDRYMSEVAVGLYDRELKIKY